jgi:hypothetical protein
VTLVAVAVALACLPPCLPVEWSQAACCIAVLPQAVLRLTRQSCRCRCAVLLLSVLRVPIVPPARSLLRQGLLLERLLVSVLALCHSCSLPVTVRPCSLLCRRTRRDALLQSR